MSTFRQFAQGNPDTNVALRAGVGANPDQAASDAELARRFNLPASAIAEDRELFSDRAKAQDAQAVVFDKPRTSGWLAANPQNARVAHDDVQNMGMIEGGVLAFENWVGKADAALESHVANLANGLITSYWEGRLGSDVAAAGRNSLSALKSGAYSMGGGILGVLHASQELGEKVDILAPVERRIFGQTAEGFFGNIFKNTGEAAQQNAAAAMPHTGRYVTDQILGGISNVPNTALALGTGLVGRAAGLSESAAAALGVLPGSLTQGGQSYEEARRQGVTPGLAAVYGITDAATEAGGEFLGERAFLHGTTLGKGLLSRFVAMQIPEQIGEQFSTLTQDFSAWAILPSNKDKSFGDFLREQPEAMLSTAIQTAVGGALANITIAGVEKAANTVGSQARRQAAWNAEAEHSSMQIEALMQAAGQSKLRERSPATFADFMQAQVQDGPLEHVFLDANTLNQELVKAGEDGVNFAAATPAIREQMAEALRTGGMIRVPVAQLATSLPGTTLEKSVVANLKIDPIMPSAAEAKENAEGAIDKLHAQFEAQLNQTQLDVSGVTSRDAVVQHFAEELDKANRFAPSYNQKYATLIGNFYAVQGAKIGLSAEEMHAQYPLSVRSTAGEPTAGESRLGQGTATVNIGLNTNDGVGITPEAAVAALKAAGVEVTKRAVHTSATEPTLVAQLDRPLTPEQADKVSRELGQESIAQTVDDQGELHGPAADKWRPFNPEFFLGLDGVPLSAHLAQASDALIGIPANAVGPVPVAKKAAADYTKEAGLAYVPPREYVKVDKTRAERIAAAFEAMEHNPNDPLVKAAYDSMIAETIAQYKTIKATGLKVEFITGEDPYGNPRNAILDVKDNNHLWVFPTDSGFGSSDLDVSDNPLLAIVPGETISGKPVRANDIFRIVHDYFGHVKEGVGFRADGEENAWRSHSAMYSPLARLAMTTETRGQNSWVNFGPHGEQNRKAGPGDTVYAPQKIGLLPDWVMTEGANDADEGTRLNQDAGGTQVVDERGLPQLVYHGTTGNFTEFKDRPRADWFTSNPRLANLYADPRRRRVVGGGAVHPVYLDIRNPVDLTGVDLVSDPQAWGEALGLDLAAHGFERTGSMNAHEVFASAAFKAAAKAAGFDGIKVDEMGSMTWAPLAPEQIKPLFSDEARAFVKPAVAAYAQRSRGYITFGSDITAQPATITLEDASDLSTFLHESGHFFLEVMAHMAAQPGAPASVVKDMDTALSWMGFEGGRAAWAGATIEQKREFHEKFARGFEAYLFEGKSPNVEMRTLFRTFQRWMTNVYKSIKGDLKVKMDPEIRGVFDRMLASDEAIRDAQVMSDMTPFFTEKPEGMTDKDWQDYQELDALATGDAVAALQTKSLRDMRFARAVHSRELKRLKAEVADQRVQVEEEVRAEISAQPVFRAQEFLKRGTLNGEPVEGPHKFDVEAFNALYEGFNETERNAVKKQLGNNGKYGMFSKEDGVNPAQVAELFGFSSPDELITSLLKAPDFETEVQAATDLRMLERYGDITSPKALEDAASLAIHNEVRVRAVATELNALEKAVGKPRLLAKAARQYAEGMISRLTVRNIRPTMYEAAERRAAAASIKALKAGDQPTAIVEKRSQLLNMAATKAAREAQEEMRKALVYLRKFSREGTRKNIDVDYLDQIDALMERFDLRTSALDSVQAGNRQAKRRAALSAWIDEQREQGYEPIFSDDDLLTDESARKHFRDLTVDEMRNLRDAVTNIDHLGRLKHELLKNKEQRRLAAVVASVDEAVRANSYKVVKLPIGARTWIEHAKSGVGEFLAMHRKFSSLTREMDANKEGGAVWEALTRPQNAAGDHEATMTAEATVRLKETFALLDGENTRKKTFEPAINDSISLETRLMFALQMGTDRNFARLTDGDNLTPEQIHAIVAPLTEKHWTFVKAAWAHIGSYWGEIAAKERRVSGVTPEKVEGRQFTVTTSDGKTLQIDGKYFPIKYDPEKSSKAEADSAAEVQKQITRGLYSRATTRRGFVKSRVEKVERATRKDFGVIFQHHSEVIHDLAWHETLIDLNKLLGAGAIDDAIRTHYGPATIRWMKKSVEDIAIGGIPAQNVLEAGANYLRTGATVAGLAWNLATALFQPLGLTNSIVRIGPQYVARGIARVFRDAASLEATTTWINEQSSFMRLRAQTQQREIAEIRQQFKAKGPVRSTIDRVPGASPTLDALGASYFILITKAQLIADVPTWAGGYEKAVAQGNSHERAVALADQAVIDSQGGGQIKDLAGVQRGSPFQKLWTNFYSWFSVAYNQLAESVNDTRRVGPSRLPLLAVDVFLIAMAPQFINSLLRGAIQGDDWDDLKGRIGEDQLSGYLGFLFGFRELGAMFGVGNAYSGPAGARAISAVVDLGKQAQQGEADDAFWKAANNAAGVVFHYPAGQVQRTVTGLHALAEGKTRNPLVVFTGPGKNER